MERRPIASRDTTWARAAARVLGRSGLTPNVISLISIAFAGLAAWACGRFAESGQAAWLLLMAAAIQLRLLCNLFDGMVAVEGGRATPTGPIYNELPDRISDLLIIVPLGYAIPSQPFGVELGWAAGVMAVLTAYVRALGGSLGAPQIFAGIMGKSQRMAVVTAAGVIACLPPIAAYVEPVLTLALMIVLVGSAVTCLQRVRLIAQHLHR